MFYMAAAAVALISCTNEETVDVDDSGTIKFRAVMGAGANSRGIETKTENLNEFMVCAVVRGQAEHYIEQQKFERIAFNEDGTAQFSSKNVYRWPENCTVDFYAYSYYPGKDGDKDNEIDYKKLGVKLSTEDDGSEDDGSEDHNSGDHTISFSPDQDITKQIDPVTAWNCGSEHTSSMGVVLEFHHILSQIQIKALSSNSIYKFQILGARIANVKSEGGTWNIANKTWTGIKSTLGTYAITQSKEPEPLTATAVSIIGDDNPAMLLPQSLTGWDPTKVKEVDGTKVVDSDGAYISVLLRITMNNTSGDHVVFPDPKAKYTKIKDNGDNEYAWANIPISTVWESGKRYIYTLNFMSGAGYDDEGEKILGDQISFTTTVKAWESKPTNLQDVANGNK